LKDEDNENPVLYYKAEIEETTFQIDERIYDFNFMEYVDQQAQFNQGDLQTIGPCKCLYKTLKEGETCNECSQIAADWGIYHAVQKQGELQEQQIKLEDNKVIPIGKLEQKQGKDLYKLLDNNKDLFATSLQELKQTSVGEHTIITKQVPPIKKRAYRTRDAIRNPKIRIIRSSIRING